MIKSRKILAFTLTELLVVVSIIALITTIATISLSTARRGAKDKNTIAKVLELQNSLEAYRMIEGEYPENDKVVPGSKLTNDNFNTFQEEVPYDVYYNKITGEDSYEISFYLEGPSDSLSAGYKCAVPGNVLDNACTGGALFFGNSGVFIDDRNNEQYSWVRIDGKIWMSSNLNIGSMLCSSIPGEAQCTENPTNNGIDNIEKYCYNNLESNCDIYGAYYAWNEAMNYVSTDRAQGICPDGWHIPSKTEYESLVSFVGDNPGLKLKASSPLFDGSNLYGFNAIRSGLHRSYGAFDSINYSASFWSSTLNYSTYSWKIEFYNENNYDNWLFTDVSNSLSLRCIKNY
ncbi:MAG: FISUMP domain-containing protein [Patescibacteria group bacterium]